MTHILAILDRFSCRAVAFGIVRQTPGLLFLLPVCLWVELADASPAFTRQTGAACTVCHFQDIRSLNAYGREFLLNSYRDSGKMIEQRREREAKMRAQGDKHDSQPLEKGNGHPEDSGMIEDKADHEALESPEEEVLEEQEKSAAPD